jgi:photosystem II stability/assembly factor-like uncharacterized protein
MKSKYTNPLLFISIFFILINPSLGIPIQVDNMMFPCVTTTTIWEEISHQYIREGAIPWDIVFINATHGWMISQNITAWGHGIVLYTNDSGLSWRLQLYNETSLFRRIIVVEETLWVTAETGLYRSSDYGESWEFISVGTEFDNYRGIFFYNESLGWIGSETGTYKTEDGGQTWQKQQGWATSDIVRSIYFITPQNGWIIADEGIYHSTSSGESWEKVHNKGGWNFEFVSDTEAWAVGDNMLAHMVDGINWVEQSLPSNEYGRPPYMTDVQFLNTTHGWIGALNPQIAHTQNGGIDWYEQSATGDEAIIALYIHNETLGWATGWDGRIYRTTQADELGEYSWSTSNVALAYGLAFALIAVVAVSVIFLCFRKRPSVVSPTLDLE